VLQGLATSLPRPRTSFNCGRNVQPNRIRNILETRFNRCRCQLQICRSRACGELRAAGLDGMLGSTARRSKLRPFLAKCLEWFLDLTLTLTWRAPGSDLDGARVPGSGGGISFRQRSASPTPSVTVIVTRDSGTQYGTFSAADLVIHLRQPKSNTMRQSGMRPYVSRSWHSLSFIFQSFF
jgi:hypothetical protein